MNYQKAIIDKIATARRIKSIIASSTLTYEQLAEMLELNSPRVIYDWANGNKLPNLENAYNLLRIFNIKIEDLLVTK